MPRPKSNGPYAPLSATYYFDDAILEAGPEAELLFVRCLAFLASSSSDGFITDRQMRQRVGIGLRNVPRRVQTLLQVELLTTQSGGYLVRAWLKWNKTTDEIGKNLKADRERKARTHAGTISNSVRNPVGIGSDSSPQITTNQSTSNQSTSLVAEPRDDVLSLCNLMADLMVANGSNRPKINQSWLDAARHILDKDGRDYTKTLNLIRWQQADPFWKAACQSMPKFRIQYDAIRLKANAEFEAKHKPTRTEENLSVVARFAAMENEPIGIEA